MMKKIITTLCLSTALFASTQITLKKGWQFVGFPSSIDDMSGFDNSHVDIVWGYDANRQNWMGYAPDANTQQKISDKYAALKHISPWQGVWIHNNDDWSLTLEDSDDQTTQITLEKGWNLISLPQDITLSPSFFEDATLWSYHDKQWQLYANNKQTSSQTPPISKIDSAQALWVNTANAKQVPISKHASALRTFSSKEEMRAYIKEMVLESYKPRFGQVDTYRMNDVATLEGVQADAPTNAKASGTTGTNLQESDVDESDILKHNDTHTFFIDNNAHEIKIRAFSDISTNQKSAIAPIPLDNASRVQAMYLYNDHLVLITQTNLYYLADAKPINQKDMMIMPQEDNEPTFKLTLYDISDIQHIKKEQSYRLDGTLQNSRITGGSLYIISQFSPQVTVSYPKIYLSSETCKNQLIAPYIYEEDSFVPQCYGLQKDQDGRLYRYDYSKPHIDAMKLIPTRDPAKTDMIIPQRFYAPHKLNQFPTITVLSKYNLDSQEFAPSLALAASTNILYASSNHLYLSSTLYPEYYDYSHYKEREMIYQFSLTDGFDYQARGFVDGLLLNSYSLSEKDDILRVATTSRNGFQGDIQNSVFTLKAQGDTLKVQGTLTGLGKKGERIKSARFIGDRGFIVTFLQTDPLYTLDMSDETAPKKVGELKINGFSNYLHPIDDNLLLTIGRDASADGRVGGFILQLFDISDFAHPALADIKRYSLNAYNFDAEYNPRAFVYRASDKRFAITYHEDQTAKMDLYKVDTQSKTIQEIVPNIAFDAISSEHRGMLFNLNNRIYATLFAGSQDMTISIGDTQ